MIGSMRTSWHDWGVWIRSHCTRCRGSHFWHTPKAGGKVDPHRVTQLGRALRDLGVPMAATAAQPAVEKPLRGKVQKATFPPRLEIPQTARDSHFPTATTAAG